MLALLLVTSLAQSPHAGVIDATRHDAAYEDESRAVVAQVVARLQKAGLVARRLEKEELPPNCTLGPCLGQAAKMHGLDVLVLVAVNDVGPTLDVVVAALWGVNGEPLGAGRWSSPHEPGKPPKALETFATKVNVAIRKKLAELAAALAKQADAGVSAPDATAPRR